ARTLVSCSLRFSRQGGVEIRSLDDLLWTIQPLNLRLYDAASLRTPKQVGEGASYTVFRYTDARTRTAVAVKKIKPPDDVNDHFAFQNRVDCVLKDIEVMHHPPIAQHENILTLLGYGWGLRRGDLIPFIVTDYASLGTLREYLQTGDVSMPSKLSICSQVACGLNRLHWTGVGHGDLKLENVLVFPNPS
ncbi:kinase-like domain-containing protein, partial [Lasiosphaeris hirsuta]